MQSNSSDHRQWFFYCTILYVSIVVIKFTIPYATHYIGLKPVSDLPSYPRWEELEFVTPQLEERNHGLDFSSILFAAEDRLVGREVYYPVDPNIYGRSKSTIYHPVVQVLYTPLTFLPFNIALSIHNTLSLVLFLVVSFFVLKRKGATSYFGPIAAITGTSMFMTIVGLYHLERGQFELYVALCLIALYMGFITQRAWWAIVCGFFATLKYTAWLPAIGIWILSLVSIGVSSFVMILPIIAILLWLPFVSDIQPLTELMSLWETDTSGGISFTLFLPKSVAKSLLFIYIIITAFFLHDSKKKEGEKSLIPIEIIQHASFPVLTSVVILSIGFFTRAGEYRAVQFLGLLTCLALWLEHTPKLPSTIKKAIISTFFLFLFVTFEYIPLTIFLGIDYLLFACVFGLYGVLIIVNHSTHTQAVSRIG